MRRLLFLLCCLWLRPSGAAEQAWGLHGMAVFGGHDGLYASHLPMFHSPHDSQIVFAFHLADAKADLRLRRSLAHRPALWTLEPEEFDLLRLAPDHETPLRQFAARFYRGHFERGGKVRLAGQTVIVDRMILFRRLTANTGAHSEGRYLTIGTPREAFLVKEIDRRPDFDLIATLKAPKKMSALPAEIDLPTDALDAPSPSVWRSALPQGYFIGKTLYFETGDLK